MNRVIKFRVWNIAQNIFYTKLKDLLEIAEYSGFESNNKIIWQQFTGLLDENGKEIYEGDIVKHDTKAIQIVFYSTEDAAFKLGAKGEKTQYDKINNFWPEQCEVIGNIYENPELLKGQND